MVSTITHLFLKKYMEQCLNVFFEMQELIDIKFGVIFIHIRESIQFFSMILAVVVVIY